MKPAALPESPCIDCGQLSPAERCRRHFVAGATEPPSVPASLYTPRAVCSWCGRERYLSDLVQLRRIAPTPRVYVVACRDRCRP